MNYNDNPPASAMTRPGEIATWLYQGCGYGMFIAAAVAILTGGDFLLCAVAGVAVGVLIWPTTMATLAAIGQRRGLLASAARLLARLIAGITLATFLASALFLIGCKLFLAFGAH